MADFFRFIRLSSNRIFGNKRSSSLRKAVESRERFINGSKSLIEIKDNLSEHGKENPLSNYIENPCIHIDETKWEDIWKNTIESKSNTLAGLVFINPNFARSYYVPLCDFRCDFDDFNEYGTISHEILAFMKNGQYDRWMQAMIRTDSCYISVHVCQVVELLDRYCIRCPQLVRLSFHYFYLDDNFVDYIIKNMPNLKSINIENSIGLSSQSFANLGNLKNLVHLNLAGSDIFESSLEKVLETCSSLESLNISNNCSITGHCLASESAKKLKRINIRDCWRINSTRLTEMAKVGLPNLIELLCNSGISDDSLEAIANNCSNLLHLDISFEEFTYNDQAGFNTVNESGFTAISKLTNLKILRLRHVGRLTDQAMAKIINSCTNLIQLTLNLRHRHKLTDNDALRDIGHCCQNLMYFEAVHNHFISKNCISELSLLAESLQVLILRGNELVKDGDISLLIQKCCNLRIINLDGCRDIGENTFAICVVHSRKLKRDSNGIKPHFRASLILTSIERSLINSIYTELPENLRIRACDYRKNKMHYNEFDGKEVVVHQLKDTFFPFYWYDYN